jgi:nucleoside 2-deoxyribosyltransferase
LSSKLYLAAPLFTAAERHWNGWLATALRGLGFDVILPQEEAERHISPSGLDFAGIFGSCLEGVQSADVIVAIFDGADVDSGTAFECGYAYARGKPVIGVRTDIRSHRGEEKGVNAMLSRCCWRLVEVSAFNTPDQLVHSIADAIEGALSKGREPHAAREL